MTTATLIDFNKLRPEDEIGTQEIAALLGLSRTYVTNEVVKRKDFPAPATRISQKTTRWRYADVLKFKRGER
jgi:predicted DNA-binding transcriptional regulator AlpA